MRTSLTVLLTLAATGAAWAGQTARPFYCEVKMTSTVDASKHTVVSKVWQITPTRFRVEKQGDGSRYITIADGPQVWMYDPATKTGEHIMQPPQVLDALAKSRRLVGDELPAFIKKGARKTGSERVGGVLCDVYSWTDKEGMVWKLWVDRTPDRLTRRQMQTGKIHGAISMGQKMINHKIYRVSDFTIWKVGAAIPESTLRVPTDVKFTEGSLKQPSGPFNPRYVPKNTGKR